MLDDVLEDDQVEAAAQVLLRLQVQDIAIHQPGVFLLQRRGQQFPSPFQSGGTTLHPHTFAAPVQEGPQHTPFAAAHLQYPGPGWQGSDGLDERDDVIGGCAVLLVELRTPAAVEPIDHGAKLGPAADGH